MNTSTFTQNGQCQVAKLTVKLAYGALTFRQRLKAFWLILFGSIVEYSGPVVLAVKAEPPQ